MSDNSNVSTVPVPVLAHPAAFTPGLDLDESAERAAQFLWNSGLDQIMSRAARDPYEEDSDIQIGSGRDGSGVKYAERAMTETWFEITDDLLEDHLDYLDTSNDSSMDDLIQSEIGSNGALSDPWEGILDKLREPELADDFEGEPFDEDDFKKQVAESVHQLAIDAGVSNLHQISYRLTGYCGGSWSKTFGLGDDSPGPWLPDFKHPTQVAHAAELLSLLNIHPLDFAKALSTQTEAALADHDCWTDAGLEGADAREAEATVRQRLDEFMGGCLTQSDPAQWTGGMGAIARAFASQAWSLPRALSAPSASAADIVERLVAEHGSVEAEFIFDVEGSALQEHSELLDRFEDSSPVCGDALANTSASIYGAEFYLDGESIALAGPVSILVNDVLLQTESAGDKAFKACMLSRRQAAGRAQHLSWSFTSADRDEPPGVLSARTLKVCSEMACDEPSAFETAEAVARARGAVDEERIALARSTVESGRLAVAQRLTLRGMAPLTSEEPLSIEAFDLRSGALVSAPWRHALSPELAGQSDSLGNTLAHKAVACLDPILLRFALAHAPACADVHNLAGRSPLDLIHLDSQRAAFISLSTELLKARPDMANTQAGSTGRVLSELAACRGHGSKDLASLVALGCSASGLSRDGSAWWTHWAYKPADFLKREIPAMLAAGWDINTLDGSGRALAHYVSRLDPALVLLELGADFSIKNHHGKSCGSGLPSEEFAQLERAILSRLSDTARPRTRPKSL